MWKTDTFVVAVANAILRLTSPKYRSVLNQVIELGSERYVAERVKRTLEHMEPGDPS